MLLCEKEDLTLAALVIEAYNYGQREDGDIRVLADKISAMEEKAFELYGSDDEPDPELIEVPVELFHRMAAEVEHHKAMLAGRGSGVIATIGASTTGMAEYGIAKDLKIEFRVALRAPDVAELDDEEINKIVDCAVEGFRATITREADILKAEIRDVQEIISTKAN